VARTGNRLRVAFAAALVAAGLATRAQADFGNFTYTTGVAAANGQTRC